MYRKIAIELIKISYPLMLTSGTFLIMLFIDRLFLSWYSQETIAASGTAGMMSFFISAFFIGIATYPETFVAQYYGAKKYTEIGKIIWQGLYFALAAGIFLIITIPLFSGIFTLMDRPVEILEHEKTYFMILQMGMGISLLGDVAIAFFAGRAKTLLIFWVIGISTIVNGIFDYALIFGKFGLPELGIAGAAIATNIAIAVRTILIFMYSLDKKEQRKISYI